MPPVDSRELLARARRVCPQIKKEEALILQCSRPQSETGGIYWRCHLSMRETAKEEQTFHLGVTSRR